MTPHHGTLNAVFLPAVLRFNQSECEAKYAGLREAMGLEPGVDLALAVEGINEEIGIEESDIAEMVEYALKVLSARPNLRRASAEEFDAMIRETLRCSVQVRS